MASIKNRAKSAGIFDSVIRPVFVIFNPKFSDFLYSNIQVTLLIDSLQPRKPDFEASFW